MLTTISTLVQSLTTKESEQGLQLLEKELRRYAVKELNSLYNKIDAIDDFVLEYIAHVLSSSVVGDPGAFAKELVFEYKYSYRAKSTSFHNLSGVGEDKRPEQLLERSDELSDLLSVETIPVKILLRGLLLHPSLITLFLSTTSIPIKQRLRVSIYLKKLSSNSVCSSTQELTMTPQDNRKSLLFQYLYELNPAMLVLLLKLGNTGDFMDVCRMFSGQTIVFPEVGRIETAVQESKRTVKVQEAFNSLLDKIEITSENSLPTRVFIEQSIKQLLEQSTATVDEMQENLQSLDPHTLLRLYTSLNSAFTKTTKLATTALQKGHA